RANVRSYPLVVSGFQRPTLAGSSAMEVLRNRLATDRTTVDGASSHGSECVPQVSGRGKYVAVLLLILFAGGCLRFRLWTWCACVQGCNRRRGTLVQRSGCASRRGPPALLWSSLYPAVVAGVYRLFGLENYQAVRLLQAILSLVNVVLLYHMGSAILSRQGG